MTALARAILGRLLEVFFGVGYDGEARVCTFTHPIAWTIHDDLDHGPPHLDVKLRLWSTGGHTSTVLAITGNRMRKHMAIEGWNPKSRTTTLESSGKPVMFEFRLVPTPHGAAIPYQAGERLPLDLLLSRGWTKKVNIPVTDPSGAS